MLEIEKLRQDMLAQNERLQRERESHEVGIRREGVRLVLAFVAGGATFLGGLAAFVKLVLPGVGP